MMVFSFINMHFLTFNNADEESDVEIRSKSVESEGDTYQLARDIERRTI